MKQSCSPRAVTHAVLAGFRRSRAISERYWRRVCRWIRTQRHKFTGVAAAVVVLSLTWDLLVPLVNAGPLVDDFAWWAPVDTVTELQVPGEFHPVAFRPEDHKLVALGNLRSLPGQGNGVPIGKITLELELTGARFQSVVIEDITLSVVSSGPPIDYGIACRSRGSKPDGGVVFEEMTFDLDQDPPIAMFDENGWTPDDDPSMRPTEPYFSRRRIVLAHDEKVFVHLRFFSVGRFTRFVVLLHLHYGSHKEIQQLDFSGYPFELTGYAAQLDQGSRNYTSYQIARIREWRKPESSTVEIDPATWKNDYKSTGLIYDLC